NARVGKDRGIVPRTAGHAHARNAFLATECVQPTDPAWIHRSRAIPNSRVELERYVEVLRHGASFLTDHAVEQLERRRSLSANLEADRHPTSNARDGVLLGISGCDTMCNDELLPAREPLGPPRVKAHNQIRDRYNRVAAQFARSRAGVCG